MTFLEKLRDIAARARYSTEPGRVVEELANVLADEFEQAEAAGGAAPAESAPADSTQTPAA